MLVAICIILAVLLIVVLLKWLLLKLELQQLNQKLLHITTTDTNAKLTINGGDKTAASLVNSINQVLAKHRSESFEKAKLEAQLKRSITNISHDLRTPLTAAKGYLQMLHPTADNAEYLSIINERLDSLATQLNSLFEFAQILEGGAVVQYEMVNSTQVLTNVLAASYAQLEAENITVTTNLPASPVKILTDSKVLERILQNLVKNVYTHGHSILIVTQTQNTITLANRISGSINTEQIFSRFYTEDASRTNKSTGLGLAIVKELAERININVTATVEDEMFYIKLLL